MANYLFTVALVLGLSALQQIKDEFCQQKKKEKIKKNKYNIHKIKTVVLLA